MNCLHSDSDPELRKLSVNSSSCSCAVPYVVKAAPSSEDTRVESVSKWLEARGG